jgi:hypothetical protein
VRTVRASKCPSAMRSDIHGRRRTQRGTGVAVIIAGPRASSRAARAARRGEGRKVVSLGGGFLGSGLPPGARTSYDKCCKTRPNERPKEGADHELINGKPNTESCSNAASYQAGGLYSRPAPRQAIRNR